MRPGLPSTVNYALLAYAVLTVVIGGAYAALSIRADYAQTLEAERGRLRSVTAALQSATLAMLNDGLGAAIAAADSVEGALTPAQATGTALGATLQGHLEGGDYVRALFLSDSTRLVLASRRRVLDTATLPAWLAAARAAAGAHWVGAPIPDPEDPHRLVIPIARRARIGQGSTGWAGALLSFEGFDKLFQQFGNDVGVLGLVTADGTVLAATSKLSQVRGLIGQNLYGGSALLRQAIAQGSSGTLEGYGLSSRMDMIYAYGLVNGYPLYVVTGQARPIVFAAWRERRRISIATASAFGLLVLVTTAFLSYYMRALRNRERDYRALFNNAQFSVLLLNGDRFIDANQTVARMFGLADERAAVGMTPWELSPERQPDGQRSEELARQRIATALREGGTTFEWLHQRADTHEPFAAEVDLSALGSGDTTLALAVVHDITARRRAEQDLRFLSAELMRLQDEERRRIGRDLHDSTGQSLAALELTLAQLQHQSATLSAPARELLGLCAQLAKNCSAEIRTASYLLHPPLLDEVGLLSALRWLADGLRARSAIDVRLDLPDEMERLPPEQELALFRVAQEALTNVHRHSGSPWAQIHVQVRPQYVALEIEDAGPGIATDAADPVRAQAALGVGLAGMRERIRQLGGVFAFESTATGTRVRTLIPRVSAPAPRAQPAAGRYENRYEAGADSHRG